LSRLERIQNLLPYAIADTLLAFVIMLIKAFYHITRVYTTLATITSRSVLQLGLSNLENHFAETTFQHFSFVDIFRCFGGSSVGV
jgi:hypothetical protein